MSASSEGSFMFTDKERIESFVSRICTNSTSPLCERARNTIITYRTLWETQTNSDLTATDLQKCRTLLASYVGEFWFTWRHHRPLFQNLIQQIDEKKIKHPEKIIDSLWNIGINMQGDAHAILFVICQQKLNFITSHPPKNSSPKSTH